MSKDSYSPRQIGISEGVGLGVGGPTRFSPLFNDAFLKIFGSADSAPVTKPLINAILREVGMPEVEGIERISADTSLPGGVECKTPRLDVVVFADDGRIIDLEAQRKKADITNKSLFYAAKLLVENALKGRDGDYSTLPQVVAIMLLEGQKLLPDDPRFLSVCRFGWNIADGGNVAQAVQEARVDGPDRIVLVAVELDKVRERYNKGCVGDVLADELLAWLYLLADGYKNPEEVGKMAESFPTMEEFAARYGIAIGDPDLKRAYDRYWESEMEYNSIMSYAKREAQLEGRREGRREGMREGMREGKLEGRREGRREGVEESIAALRAAGMDEAADLLERGMDV